MRRHYQRGRRWVFAQAEQAIAAVQAQADEARREAAAATAGAEARSLVAAQQEGVLAQQRASIAERLQTLEQREVCQHPCL